LSPPSAGSWRAGAEVFLAELYGVSRVLEADKDERVFPSWSKEVAADLVTETSLFLSDWLWNGSSRLSELFTSGPLAELRG
jgi:hypothetical protein